jgi:aspartate/methionine/tyrosine aminotransferase
MYDDVPADIRDACYNWSHYTKHPVKLRDKVVIFSLSKLSGHSSTRIGWAIVKDADVAAKMREYVELFSSGVSIQSQESAAHILRRLNTKNGRLLLKLAQATLSDRHKAIQRIVKEKSLPVKILSERGMFLYVQCRPQFIYDLKITCFAGSECGDTQKGRYRLNLGCTDEAYRELIARLEALADLYSDK